MPEWIKKELLRSYVQLRTYMDLMLLEEGESFFFQDVAISIPMLQWVVLQNYSHAQTASTKWTVVLKKTIHNVWRKRWRWKVENELERRDSGFYKKQLHECIKLLKSGVFKNKVKLKKKNRTVTEEWQRNSRLPEGKNVL